MISLIGFWWKMRWGYQRVTFLSRFYSRSSTRGLWSILGRWSELQTLPSFSSESTSQWLPRIGSSREATRLFLAILGLTKKTNISPIYAAACGLKPFFHPAAQRRWQSCEFDNSQPPSGFSSISCHDPSYREWCVAYYLEDALHVAV
jgi:hypothetical protein